MMCTAIYPLSDFVLIFISFFTIYLWILFGLHLGLYLGFYSDFFGIGHFISFVVLDRSVYVRHGRGVHANRLEEYNLLFTTHESISRFDLGLRYLGIPLKLYS